MKRIRKPERKAKPIGPFVCPECRATVTSGNGAVMRDARGSELRICVRCFCKPKRPSEVAS